MQVLDADGARFGGLESGAFEQPYDLREIDVTVSVPEMPSKALSLRLGPGEVNEEHPAAGLDNPTQLGRKFSTSTSAEVMQHHCAKRQIEARVGKRKRLGGGTLESDLDGRPRRFRARPGEHFRRGVDAADCTGAPDGLLRENREGTGSACDIQHGLAGSQAGQIEKPPTQLPLAPSQGEPYDRIVEQRRVQDSANGPLHRVLTRHGPITHKMDTCSISSVGSRAMPRKNGKHQFVRYRTLAPTLSRSSARDAPTESLSNAAVTLPGQRVRERPDRRIQRTRTLLHEALGSLIREKSYDRITVAEILDRARVSRSTFYIHFRDKDELLTSSMHALLLGVLSADGGATTDAAERMVAFSLPLLTHIHQHRRSSKARLGERGRGILHEHLRRVLSEWIAQTASGDLRIHQSRRSPIVPELLAQHIASTFVLILHWWMDDGVMRSPAEADKLFRALVMPVLRSPHT